MLSLLPRLSLSRSPLVVAVLLLSLSECPDSRSIDNHVFEVLGGWAIDQDLLVFEFDKFRYPMLNTERISLKNQFGIPTNLLSAKLSKPPKQDPLYLVSLLAA